MNKKVKLVIIGTLLFFIVLSIFLILFKRVRLTTSYNPNFIITYDSTWKNKGKDNEIDLIHNKTKSELRVQCKLLDVNDKDTNLSEIIDDVMYSIEEQNQDYKLINTSKDISEKYEAYSYLYEKDDKQVMVNIYKKNVKLVIAYYETETKYFDMLLPNVDIILDSLEIVFEGE